MDKNLYVVVGYDAQTRHRWVVGGDQVHNRTSAQTLRESRAREVWHPDVTYAICRLVEVQ